MSDQPTNILKDATFRTRLVPLRVAARLAGKRYGYVKKLVDAGQLRAFRDGGSDERPHLKVLPEDLEAALRRSMLYVPPAKTRAGKVRQQKTHPKVTC